MEDLTDIPVGYLIEVPGLDVLKGISVSPGTICSFPGYLEKIDADVAGL